MGLGVLMLVCYGGAFWCGGVACLVGVVVMVCFVVSLISVGFVGLHGCTLFGGLFLVVVALCCVAC